MAISMAGSRGGIVGHTQGVNGREFISRLLTGRIGFDELYEHFITSPARKAITLVVNNACNLSCAHCYLQVKRLSAPALKEKEWERLIDSIAETEPELICLSGKEVFLSDKSIALLSYLSEVRDRKPASYRLGVITNGTLVHKHRDVILRADLNYFDISLDGLEADHDAVRGKGAFAEAIPNIEWAASALKEKFFINLTLQRQNAMRLVETIDFLQQSGVRNISCGFYRPLSYTVQHLSLSDDDINQIFERVSQLEKISLRQPLTVLFDLDIINLQPLKSFLRSEWFSLDSLRQDANGEHYIEHKLVNGIRLEIRFTPYPTGIWHSLRITPEGKYLAAENTIDTTLYSERYIGGVREFDFNFPALQAHALASDRFRQILHDYCNRVLPELADAHNGRALTAAA